MRWDGEGFDMTGKTKNYLIPLRSPVHQQKYPLKPSSKPNPFPYHKPQRKTVTILSHLPSVLAAKIMPRKLVTNTTSRVSFLAPTKIHSEVLVTKTKNPTHRFSN